jgi:hypothetical protein
VLLYGLATNANASFGIGEHLSAILHTTAAPELAVNTAPTTERYTET